MTTNVIMAVLASYILLAVLVLSVGITSMWRWWVKLGALVTVGGLFVATFVGIVAVLGWPNPYGTLPVRFKLLWSSVVEPDRLTTGAGAVYLWVEEIDGNNVPSKKPRSFQVAYTEELATEVRAAQDRRANGEQIMGELHLDVVEDAFGDTQLVDPNVEPVEQEEEAPRVTITFQELPPEITSEAPAPAG